MSWPGPSHSYSLAIYTDSRAADNALICPCARDSRHRDCYQHGLVHHKFGLYSSYPSPQIHTTSSILPSLFQRNRDWWQQRSNTHPPLSPPPSLVPCIGFSQSPSQPLSPFQARTAAAAPNSSFLPPVNTEPILSQSVNPQPS